MKGIVKMKYEALENGEDQVRRKFLQKLVLHYKRMPHKAAPVLYTCIHVL